MKVGYFADGPWSHLALEKILVRKAVEVAFICVRADSQDPVLPAKAKELNIPCLRHSNVNSPEFITQIASFNCDMNISMSFDQIFRKTLLELTPDGMINCHAGKLPLYRGRNILNWALINDEKEFGITVHYVDEGIDTGDIILQETYPISDEDNYSTLLDRAYTGCADVLDRAIHLVAMKDAKRIKQKEFHPVGSYCGRRVPGDEVINWNQTSRELFNFARALCKPGPIATSRFRGCEVKINRIREIVGAPVYKGNPGQILSRTQNGWLVKTQDSFVEILEIETAHVKLCVGERFK
jgi:methionyl-tRNA formyltransferase